MDATGHSPAGTHRRRWARMGLPPSPPPATQRPLDRRRQPSQPRSHARRTERPSRRACRTNRKWQGGCPPHPMPITPAPWCEQSRGAPRAAAAALLLSPHWCHLPCTRAARPCHQHPTRPHHIPSWPPAPGGGGHDARCVPNGLHCSPRTAASQPRLLPAHPLRPAAPRVGQVGGFPLILPVSRFVSTSTTHGPGLNEPRRVHARARCLNLGSPRPAHPCPHASLLAPPSSQCGSPSPAAGCPCSAHFAGITIFYWCRCQAFITPLTAPGGLAPPGYYCTHPCCPARRATERKGPGRVVLPNAPHTSRHQHATPTTGHISAAPRRGVCAQRAPSSSSRQCMRRPRHSRARALGDWPGNTHCSPHAHASPSF